MRKTNIMLDSNLLPILFYTAGLAASGTKVFKNEFISRPFYTENIKSVAFHQKLKVLAHDHHEAVGQRQTHLLSLTGVFRVCSAG